MGVTAGDDGRSLFVASAADKLDVEFLGDDTYYREMTDRVHEIVREREFEEEFEDY